MKGIVYRKLSDCRSCLIDVNSVLGVVTPRGCGDVSGFSKGTCCLLKLEAACTSETSKRQPLSHGITSHGSSVRM